MSAGLRFGAWEDASLPGSFLWTDRPVTILGVFFCLDILLEMNLSKVQEQCEEVIRLLFQRNLYLEGNV